MVGIVSGVDYSLLFPSATGGTDAATSVLNALYGGQTGPTAPTGFVSTGNPAADLTLARKQQASGVKLEAKQPEVRGALAQFDKAVAGAKTVQQALSNPSVQKVLLTANGLSGMIGQEALVVKALLSDPNDPKSLVRRLGNTALLETAKTFDFAGRGLAALRDPKTQAALRDGYTQVMWRKSLNAATPGLSDALDFLDKAASIHKLSDVLGDATVFKVVTKALGIPQQIVNQDITAVRQAINSKLDFAKLKDPHYVSSLTDQYLLNMQAEAASGSTGGTSGSLTALTVRAVSLTA